MDECDTAAKVFECVKETEPNVVLEMINAFEKNPGAVYSQTPQILDKLHQYFRRPVL